MELLQFVKEKLGEHKVKGKEIVVKKCPHCGKEKWKFSINTEKGLYQCFSGSCRSTGHIDKLYSKFNVENPKKKYNTKELDIKKHITSLSKKGYEFLEKRGITKETINKNVFDIMGTKNDEVAFVYRKKFEVHSVKFRGTAGKTFRGLKYKDLTLWKLDFCDPDKALIITEGEIDQLTFEEQGIANSVSVPSGASSLNWIDTDFEDLEQFKEIIIAFDSDKAGKEGVRKLIRRMPEDAIVKTIDFLDYKDANEVHLAGLKIIDFINNAVEVEEHYFQKMTEIDISKPTERFDTGILYLNRAIGGNRPGEVSIHTGTPGSGKSTILNQLTLEAMEQGLQTVVYSPELTSKQYKMWTCRQMIGEDRNSVFDKYYDSIMQRDVFVVKKEIADNMSLWIDKNMKYLTEKIKFTEKQLLKTIKKEIKRSDARVFVIDNVMKIIFENVIDIYDSQKEFFNELSSIAKVFNVAIHIVAHPKKHDMFAPDQYCIAGSSNIPNLVDNIYYWKRVTEHCLETGFKNKYEHYTQNDITTVMMPLKSREGEKIGEWLEFSFDPVRKRIFAVEEERKFLEKWKIKDIQGIEGIDMSDELPELFR